MRVHQLGHLEHCGLPFVEHGEELGVRVDEHVDLRFLKLARVDDGVPEPLVTSVRGAGPGPMTAVSAGLGVIGFARTADSVSSLLANCPGSTS